jgi:hypothetical protein
MLFLYSSDNFFVLSNYLVTLIPDLGRKYKKFSPSPDEFNFCDQFVTWIYTIFIPHDLLHDVRTCFKIFYGSRNKRRGYKADKFILSVTGIGGCSGKMAFKITVVLVNFFHSHHCIRSINTIKNAVDLIEGRTSMR